MSLVEAFAPVAGEEETEYVAFHVGDLLLGIDIAHVDEINRHVEITPVPHAPDFVRGVLNLRGDVVTVIDLRMVLGMPPTDSAIATRTIIVRSRGEQIGLWVDRIADVVRLWADGLDPLPPNMGDLGKGSFRGVHKLDDGLLVVLDVDAALA